MRINQRSPSACFRERECDGDGGGGLAISRARGGITYVAKVPLGVEQLQACADGAKRFAARAIAKNLRPGQLMILEPTTYPGTTETVLRPILDSSGLAAGEGYHLVFSPERIDPGNKQFGAKNPRRSSAGSPRNRASVRLRSTAGSSMRS